MYSLLLCFPTYVTSIPRRNAAVAAHTVRRAQRFAPWRASNFARKMPWKPKKLPRSPGTRIYGNFHVLGVLGSLSLMIFNGFNGWIYIYTIFDIIYIYVCVYMNIQDQHDPTKAGLQCGVWGCWGYADFTSIGICQCTSANRLQAALNYNYVCNVCNPI